MRVLLNEITSRAAVRAQEREDALMVAAMSGTNPEVLSEEEEAAIVKAELDAERTTILRLRKQCRARRRFDARRLALLRRWECTRLSVRILLASDPGRVSMTPLWWVQYVAMFSFAVTITSRSTLISGGNLLLLLIYVCSVEALSLIHI